MSWMAPVATELSPPAESVNKADFQFRQGVREKPIRPRDEIELTSGPFAGESSTQDAYRAYEPQARYRHQQPAYMKPEGTMDLTTSYSNQFVNGAASYARLPPIRPESQHRQRGQQQQQQQSFSTEQSISYPNYRRAQLAAAKQPSCRPARQYRPPDAPFQGRSSYSGDFGTAVAGAAVAEKPKPVRHEDQLRLAATEGPAPMESRGGSTNAAYGLGALAASECRRQPIVPRGELELSRDPMAAATTAREAFTPKVRAGPPPTRRRQPQLQAQNSVAGPVAG